MAAYQLQVNSKKSITFPIAISWSVILLILQLIFYRYYESKQSQILASKEIIQTCVSVVGLFGFEQLIAGSILTKENFIKFNAIYTFIISIIFTVGTSIVIAIMSKTFHFLNFLWYLISENGMSHVPPYTFFAIIFINLCTLLALSVPQHYFGKLKYKRKGGVVLIFYFVIISILK